MLYASNNYFLYYLFPRKRLVLKDKPFKFFLVWDTFPDYVSEDGISKLGGRSVAVSA